MAKTKKRESIKSSDLTPAEKLLLLRRSEGKSRLEMAEHYNVSGRQYAAWERGEGKPPRVGIGKLLPGAGAFIHRRRAGHTQADVSASVGLCRWWINRMEHDQVDPAPLVKHWEG